MITLCGVLYLLYRRRRRARLIQHANAADHHEPDSVESQVMDMKDEGESLDPPPTYPYEKATSHQNIAGTPGSTPDTPSISRSHDQSHLSNIEPPDNSNAGFYGQSSKQEWSGQISQDPNTISFHNRPEIDSIPLHEAPESSKQNDQSAIGELSASNPSSQSRIYEPGPVGFDHLSKLEQEERQLSEDILQIERLERLKLERDRVRYKIRDLSEQPRRESS